MPPEQADLSGLRPLDARFEERIELAGWQAVADPAEPSKLPVDLGWRALDRSVTDYTAFVHVLDGDGRIVAQHDQPPGGVDNQTARWVPGETIRTSMALELPPDVNRMDLRLRVGLYEPVSGRQLAVTAPPARKQKPQPVLIWYFDPVNRRGRGRIGIETRLAFLGVGFGMHTPVYPESHCCPCLGVELIR